jgi:hypothetical protein
MKDLSFKGYVSKVLNRYTKEYDKSEKEKFYNDIIDNGLVSGIISELIYYTDTLKCYSKYADDIETIINDWEDISGDKFCSLDYRKGCYYNYAVWFAFELVVNNIIGEIE